MKLEKLFEKLEIKKDDFRDLHITRMYSSFVAVSEGKVIKMTEPFLEYCPLANLLYHYIEKFDSRAIKESIKEAVEEKISDFGYFTAERELSRKNIAIPYGASEMLMYALKKKEIDSAVVVCDGAGTVITDKPDIVQGIGARMNGLFYTTPIDKLIKNLERNNCYIVFPETADINQISGLEKAAELGYKKIAVTINGYMGDDLARIKELEKKYNISVTSLAVCTTCIDEKRIKKIKEHADLVWSCASGSIREIIGKKAILQVSIGIPVFVLTKKGLDFISSYSSNKKVFRDLNIKKQYLLSGNHKGKRINMGKFDSYLTEAKLPVRSEKEPRPLT